MAQVKIPSPACCPCSICYRWMSSAVLKILNKWPLFVKQVTRCGGLRPAKAPIQAMLVTPPAPLRHCRGCTAFGSVTTKQISHARPSSRWMQQGKPSQRALDVTAAASAQAVPLEQLLEVAERAAKAGAAVSRNPRVPDHASAFRIRRAVCITAVGVLQVIAEKVDKPRDIEFKGATDLVTDTDKASEEAVLSVSPCNILKLMSPNPPALHPDMPNCSCRLLDVACMRGCA